MNIDKDFRDYLTLVFFNDDSNMSDKKPTNVDASPSGLAGLSQEERAERIRAHNAQMEEQRRREEEDRQLQEELQRRRQRQQQEAQALAAQRAQADAEVNAAAAATRGAQGGAAGGAGGTTGTEDGAGTTSGGGGGQEPPQQPRYIPATFEEMVAFAAATKIDVSIILQLQHELEDVLSTQVRHQLLDELVAELRDKLGDFPSVNVAHDAMHGLRGHARDIATTSISNLEKILQQSKEKEAYNAYYSKQIKNYATTIPLYFARWNFLAQMEIGIAPRVTTQALQAKSIDAFIKAEINAFAVARSAWGLCRQHVNEWMATYGARLQAEKQLQDAADADLDKTGDWADDDLEPDSVKGRQDEMNLVSEDKQPVGTSTPLNPGTKPKKLSFEEEPLYFPFPPPTTSVPLEVFNMFAQLQKQVADLRQQQQQSFNTSAAPAGQTWIKELVDAVKGEEKSAAKLPFLQLKKFDGKIEDWPDFFDNFYSNVHSKKKMSLHDKWNYLKQQLVKDSDAEKAVAGFSDNSASYIPCLDFLKKRYGSKRLLFSTLLRNLLFKPQVRDMKQARGMLDFLHGSIRQMESHKIVFNDAASNLLLLSALESKIPEKLLQLWNLEVLERENKDPPPVAKDNESSSPLQLKITVQDFLTFCEGRLLVLEQAEVTYRHGQPNQPNKVQGGSNGVQQPQKRKQQQQQRPQQAGPAPQSAHILLASNPPASSNEKKDATGAAGNVAGGGTKKSNGGNRYKKKAPAYDYFPDGTCIWCGNNSPSHDFKKCKAGDAMSLRERWARLRRRQKTEMLCVTCFGRDHLESQCTKTCGVKGCDKRHHPYLHLQPPQMAA